MGIALSPGPGKALEKIRSEMRLHRKRKAISKKNKMKTRRAMETEYQKYRSNPNRRRGDYRC